MVLNQLSVHVPGNLYVLVAERSLCGSGFLLLPDFLAAAKFHQGRVSDKSQGLLTKPPSGVSK